MDAGQHQVGSDTTHLSELIQNIDQLMQLELNGPAEAWKNTLRKELTDAAKSPEDCRFVAGKAAMLGKQYRNNFRMQESLFWHKLEYEMAQKGRHDEGIIQALNNLGLIYRRIDKYELAIESYQQAILLAEKTGLTNGIVYALNGLGNIHLELGNYDEAMLNFRECLRQEQQRNNMLGIAINLNNIGHVYRQQGDNERALEYFMLSLEVNQEIPSQRGIAICYNDIGEIYQLRGDKSKALSYYELSLGLNQLIGDIYYQGINHLKIAEIYFDRGEIKAAQNHLDEAIRLSKKTHNRSNLMKVYRLKYKTEQALGNNREAMNYLEKAWVLNDSIMNESTQRKLLQMQATFNRERANSQIALLENEKMLAELQFKRQKDYNLLVVAGLIIMVVVLVMMAHLLFSKNKAMKALAEKNREVEQAQLQLAEYNQQLLKAKQEAEQNNKLKSQFLANMSHEIRTPLNSVIGFSDLLSEKITDPVKLSYLDSIRSSGRSLLMLIEDILDLSKIEAGKVKPELHSLNLTNLFLELKRIFELQAFQKNILLRFDTSPDFPEIILMHEGSLRQIMVNLIGNALKFTDSGQISVEASVLARNEDTCDIMLRVSDTGRGIDSTDLNHIFDAFYQSQSNGDKQKGTGLGLTITRRLVELLNGNIAVASKPGEGTTFEIIFRDVKTLAYRTSLRLGSDDKPASPVVLLSTDNTLIARLDGLFGELGITCDLIDQPVTMQKHCLQPNCRIALWDDRIRDQAEPLPHDASECIHILLTNQPLQQQVASSFNMVINLPEDFVLLKGKISEILFGKVVPEPGINGAELNLDLMKEDEKALVDAYRKALDTQLVQDVAAFARQLEAFGKLRNRSQLMQMGQSLAQAAHAFDIEKINFLLDEFGQLLKLQTHNA